jgi:hypothetical protein
MTRKSRLRQLNEDRLIPWYKWEFLRRNAEYGRDYQGFMREFGSWFRTHGYWYDQTRIFSREAFQFFAEVIAPKAKTICERWQIRDPFSPEWNFGRSGSRRFKRHWELFLPTDCSKGAAGKMWDLPDFLLSEKEFSTKLVKSTRPKRGPRLDHELTLVFDLRLPLDRLLHEAKDRIKTRKAVYDRMRSAVPKTTPTVRRRLDLYDVYLRVWDLRADNQTFPAIGELVFLGQATATQRATDSFQRAKELIGGRYKELR